MVTSIPCPFNTTKLILLLLASSLAELTSGTKFGAIINEVKTEQKAVFKIKAAMHQAPVMNRISIFFFNFPAAQLLK